MAVALSTLHYVVEKVGCAVLFITHYPMVSQWVDSINGASASRAADAINSISERDPPMHNQSVPPWTGEEMQVNNENAANGQSDNSKMYEDGECGDGTACVRGQPGLPAPPSSISGAAVNVHMDYLLENENRVVFLYTVIEGAAKGSYGLNVASLAGLDDGFLATAKQQAEWMLANDATKGCFS